MNGLSMSSFYCVYQMPDLEGELYSIIGRMERKKKPILALTPLMCYTICNTMCNTNDYMNMSFIK